MRGLQSSVETVQESMGSAMAGVAVNMERSMAMMDAMNNVMEQYLTESVRTGKPCKMRNTRATEHRVAMTTSCHRIQSWSAASSMADGDSS